MYSTIFLLLFTAFYLLYNLSKRVAHKGKPNIAVYFSEHAQLSRITSLIITLIASVLLCLKVGAGAGVFSVVLVLMACGSLIAVLAPFRYIRLRHAVLIYSCSMLVEMFVF